jgi:hypothetical protein
VSTNRTRPSGRGARTALSLACAGALALATLTVAAGPVSAGVPTKGGKADSTSTAASSPNKDDDAIKDPAEACKYTDHSFGNGKENDVSSCTETPVVPDIVPPPATVRPAPLVFQAPTVASDTDLLGCGETITTDGKGINPDVAVTRIADANQTGTVCDPFPYELKSIPDGLRFVKPSGYPLSQFFVNVTWYSSAEDLSDAPTVDFEAVKGGYPVEVPICPSELRDENGEVVGATIEPGASAEEFAAWGIVDQDGSPSVWNEEDNGLTQYACVADTEVTFEPWAPGGSRYAVHQRLFLLGDVIFRR